MLPVQGAAHGEKPRAENSNRADPTSKRHQPRFGRTPPFEKRKAARDSWERTTLQDERDTAARVHIAEEACT